MKKTIRDLDLKDKRVLIRVDFNVPLDARQEITDDTRIRSSLATIRYALKEGARSVILMSHLGRPQGKSDPRLSLRPCAERLAELLGRPVTQAPDAVGAETEKVLGALERGGVALLENLRFHPEEEKNDPGFAEKLARYGDVYLNDAFGTSHRAHASVEAITRHLPSAAGFLLEKEIRYLGDVLKSPERPFVALLGGAKVSDKIGVVENLMDKVDTFLIGGAMAYTFYKVQGKGVGKSRVEEDKLDLARSILKKAKAKGVEILLPVDNIVVREVKEDQAFEVSPAEIGEGKIGVDIGPETRRQFSEILRNAKTIVWNGPMGIFEMKPFREGSLAVARAIAENGGATTIVGGGDTAACVIQLGFEDKVSHISTGGGASLEYLEGRKLPGIEALPNQRLSQKVPGTKSARHQKCQAPKVPGTKSGWHR